jgi:hypothetical protein
VKGAESSPQELGISPFLFGALPLLLPQTTVAGSRYFVVNALSFESFSLLCDVSKLTAAQFSDPVLFIRFMLQTPNTLSLVNITPKHSCYLSIYIFKHITFFLIYFIGMFMIHIRNFTKATEI